jgi:hypothetical protein
MKISKNSLALTAALAGLVGGTAVRASQIQPASGSTLYAGVMAEDGSTKSIEKHSCKGMNSCKGQGGGDKKHWGKNSCKGQGACATDGSAKKKL